jgi:glycosyltransferase involved in cell wall biosynthesis
LHVLIEIHPSSKKLNIIDVEHLPSDKTLVTPSELLSQESYQHLAGYFDGVKSVHFAVHPKKGLLSSIKFSRDIYSFVKKVKPDVLHVEALVIRAINLVPSILFFKKLVMSIHDPVQHSGEMDWKTSFLKFVYFHLPIRKHYLFYSKFARNQFNATNKNKSKPKSVLLMQPYTYFNKIQKAGKQEAKHILFFGRLSKYKGIDVLLKAIPEVFKEFPEETFVIAGKQVNGYAVDERTLNHHRHNITLINKHIPNSELVQLISNSKFIVCPYLDATQSGVLMTAWALDTPVIVSDAGAFPEYVDEQVNGLLSPAGDDKLLSEKIRMALRDDFYTSMKKNIEKSDKNKWDLNKDILLQSYSLQ